MRALRSTAIASLFFLPVCSYAEDEYSHKIEFYQQTSDGKTSVCGVEQTILFKDNINDSALGGLHLFISFIGDAKKFLAAFKFSDGTFFQGPGGPITQEPIANASVYFDGKSFPLTHTACQNDNKSFCGGLGGDQAGYLATALSLGGAKLRFNRNPGQLDYDFDISLKPNVSMGNQETLDFAKAAPSHTQCLISIWSLK